MPYPAGPFDTTDLVQETISSFWTDIYGGRDLVNDYIRAGTTQERQLDQQARELFDSMGRQTCPVYHKDLWLPVEIREDQGTAASLLHYGDNLVYGEPAPSGEVYQYGGAYDQSWQFPISADIINCQLLSDDIAQQQTVLTANTEFSIEPRSGYLVFAVNPFLDSRFTPFTDQDGIRKIRLYLFDAARDWRYLETLYGNVAGILGDSSEAYRDFLNAVLDGVMTGSAMDQVYRAVQAATGIPFAVGDETVLVVEKDAQNILIITDQRVYKLPQTTTATVSVGDVLAANQRLTDAVKLDEISHMIPSELSSLTLNPGLIFPGLGALTFNNAQTDLVVQEGVSGYTKISFSLGGDSGDVAAFFSEMHTRGVANNATLANYLDIRSNPTTQPNAFNLPTTINPLKFLLENVLRGTICLIRVKTAEISQDGIGIEALTALRTIMPPHAALITIEE